nr:unnamed protein product [Digitaria exilis]
MVVQDPDWLNDVLSLVQHRTWKSIDVPWSRYRVSAKLGEDGMCSSSLMSVDLAFLLSQKVGLDGEQLQTAAQRQEQRCKLCYKNSVPTLLAQGGSLYSAATYELTEENVDRVLDDMRPYLIFDGGTVTVVSVEDVVISLKLEGETKRKATGYHGA